ncbi:cupin domain-containing protein [Lentzea sp. NPDC051838]|uniref:cupin domain-containing protein n=1 Tax=Lentzea sp. NPDC051838 TaxID=3154849 RepID=UPI003433CFC7
MGSRYVVHTGEVEPEVAEGVVTRPVLTEEFGCEYLTQAVRTVTGKAAFHSGKHEELLFVLAGHGSLRVNGEEHAFGPESGIYIGPDETYEIASDLAEIVCVKVAEPQGEAGSRRTVSPLGEQELGHATAGREYRILADPSTGFRSGTHFVGDVPAGEPAPLHYHLYNEVIYVLQGNGILHIDGERNPIYPGACIHLPARTLHQVENTGDVPIREVAVFVPAGSPAAAYLPNGTSAYPGVPNDPLGGVTV